MASIGKFTMQEVGSLFKHNNRTSQDTIHSNEKIDPTKTFQNYHIVNGNINTLTGRLNDVFSDGRKNQVVLCELCITLPHNVKENDEKAFFRSVYDFCVEDYGIKNIINAVVHKDESTPHLHLDFVPVVAGNLVYENRNRNLLQEWKENHKEQLALLKKEYGKPTIERLCASELINREYLMSFHSRLNEYISKELGYEAEIINGATANGNKKVLELKAETLKSEIAALEQQKAILEKEVGFITSVAEKSGVTKQDIGLLPLMQKITDLERMNAVYRNIIAKNSYTYSKDELSQLRERNYIPAMSVNVNVFDGTLANVEISDNSFIFIELFNKEARPLPQQEYIDTNEDLQSTINLALKMNNGKEFFVRTSKVNPNNAYMFIRTDNAEETIRALFELQRRLIEQEEDWRGKKIYMEKISNDEFDLARQILEKTQFEVIYLTGNEKAKIQKEHERTKDK